MIIELTKYQCAICFNIYDRRETAQFCNINHAKTKNIESIQELNEAHRRLRNLHEELKIERDYTNKLEELMVNYVNTKR